MMMSAARAESLLKMMVQMRVERKERYMSRTTSPRHVITIYRLSVMTSSRRHDTDAYRYRFANIAYDRRA